jgi:tryptophanase
MTKEELASPSPINTERLGGQNQRLYAYLSKGRAIHVLHPAKQKLKIGYLNSRIADLVKHNIPIIKKRITVKDTEGLPVSVVKYALKPTT